MNVTLTGCGEEEPDAGSLAWAYLPFEAPGGEGLGVSAGGLSHANGSMITRTVHCGASGVPYFAAMLHPRSLMLFLALLLAVILNAQVLHRKGSLGAQLEAVAEDKGVRVVRVIPGTTAASIGLRAGDVVRALNGTRVNTVGALVDVVRNWESDMPLVVRIARGGRERDLKGRVVGKPLETSDQGSVIYGEVPFDGGALRSILELPHGVHRPPVVLWLPGVGCYSQDYAADPRSPYKQWVEGLVERGIAVFRVEKPGMGDSRNRTSCLDMDFDHEVAAYCAALAHLRSLPDIDPERIFLYGHSMGVLSLPRVAASGAVAGAIAWGGVATTWFEYELRLIREQEAIKGMDPVAIEERMRARLPLLTDFYLHQRPVQELAQRPEHAAALAEYYDGRTWHGLQHPDFFQDIGRLDILAAYRALDRPMLLLAGEHDLHAIDTGWATTIADAVNRSRAGSAICKVVPGTTHHYHTVPSMQEYVDMEADGRITAAYMAEHFNAEVPRLIAEWMFDRGKQ